MNIRDSYIHGADGKGVVKRLFFATAADVTANSDLHVNDLVFLLADTLGTQVPLTIPTLDQNTSGYASSLLTVESTSANNHYLTFVDSNNTTAEAESFYTSGDIYFKPSTGVLTVKSVTVSNTFNYSGIGSDTTSNAARKIWFASSSDGTPVVSDNFKYNPSTKTLTVDKISGPTIVIGNTTLYLDGANNVLTPDTVISNTSTDNTIPSSKAVWDAILTGMQANDAMVFKGFLTGGTDADHTTYTPGADRGDTYKVQTAGYINGLYYQVNDTFICTEDNTIAADSNKTTAQMDAIKANWGIVEGNGDFLDIHGGTMYGTLSWDGTTALPTVTTASSILVVDSNVTKQISLANLLASMDLQPSISNGSVANTVKITVNGTDSSDYIVPYATESSLAYLLKSRLSAIDSSGIQFIQGLIKTGNSSGLAYAGSSTNFSLLSFPEGKTTINLPGTANETANIALIRIVWGSANWHDLHFSPNNSGIFHRVSFGSGTAWKQIVETAGDKGNSTKPVYVSGGLVYECTAYADASVKSATTATSSTNLLGGAAGSIPYQSAADTTTFLAGGSNNQVLRYNSTTKAPYWSNDVDTWRNIYVNGSSKIGTGSGTKALNITASGNLTIGYVASGTGTGQSSDYFTVSIDATAWSGATSTTDGTAGYMPGAASADRGKYLRGDGSWIALNPSISTGTTDTKKIKITVGGEASGEYLVPYASNADKVDGYHASQFFKLYTRTDIGTSPNFNNPKIGNEPVNGYFELRTSRETTGESGSKPFDSFASFINITYSNTIFLLAGNNSNGWKIRGRLVADVETLGTGDDLPWLTILTNINSSVSGGNTITNDVATPKPGDTLTVKINNTTKSLTIPTISSQASSTDVTKTLKVDTWTTMVAINTWDAGTYAIQISSGNVYASGVFTVCKGTDSVVDEIPLHVADKGTNTWRPYARVSGNNLQMTTSETTGTARTYTIKTLRLI